MAASILPRPIITMMAAREHRVHHYLWHTIRNGWLRFNSATRAQLRDRGWEPPRPAYDAQRALIEDNNSGEDFLFMHRQMIAAVRAKLREIGEPADHWAVQGWRTIPRPADGDYPVPPAWSSGNERFDRMLLTVKSGPFYENRIARWEDAFTNDAELRRMSLGVLGARIEDTIHNALHMRFCARPEAIRPNNGSVNDREIATSWDDERYDWLGDTYSSHVNPVFWKLHGWVDDRIDQWARGNGVDPGAIPWKGKWVGQMPGHLHSAPLHLALATTVRADGVSELASEHPGGHASEHPHRDGSGLEEVLRIVLQSDVRCNFYDGLLGGMDAFPVRPAVE